MENQRQTDLTIGDVDCLLKNFSRLWNLPAPNLPERDEALWRQAIDKAWQRQERHAETVATAMAVGGGSPADVRADLKRRKALRTAEEEQTGLPSPMGLSDRFVKEAERIYLQLDLAYAKAERAAQRKVAAEAAPLLDELDLLLVSVKAGLLQWSEFSTNIGTAGAWKTYQDALGLLGKEPTASRRGSGECSALRKRPPVGKVIRDLRRMKAKLERLGKGTALAESKRGKQRVSEGRMSQKEATVMARDWLPQHPSATARELHEATGISLGMIPKLTPWQAHLGLKKERGRKAAGRKRPAVKGRKARDKQERRTEREEELLKLIREQDRDAALQKRGEIDYGEDGGH